MMLKKKPTKTSAKKAARRTSTPKKVQKSSLGKNSQSIKGIPIAKMLSKGFKAPSPAPAVSVEDPSIDSIRTMFERVEADQDWENHELCQKYGFPPEEVRLAAQSVIDVGRKAYLGSFGGKSEREKLEDRAIMKVFRPGNLSTGQQLALLAERFLKIEKAGMKTMTLQRLGDKLRNFEYRKEPGKILISEHQEFDLWLCRNWVKKEMLCRLSNKKIGERWALHKGGKRHDDNSKFIESRINRAHKLRRPKLKKSQPQ